MIIFCLLILLVLDSTDHAKPFSILALKLETQQQQQHHHHHQQQQQVQADCK